MSSEVISVDHARMIELRRYTGGELAGAERERIALHLASCAECGSKLAILERESASMRSIDVAVESAKILERLDREPPQASSFFARMFEPRLRWVPVAIVFVLLAIPLALVIDPEHPGGHGTRLKGGGPSLEMFVKDAAGVRRANDDEALKAGDQIQFRYRAEGKRYVFVVSVSDAGELSPLYPDREGESVPIASSGTHVLEGSVILDASRGHERVFAFFSDRPLAYGEVDRALRERLAGERDVTRLQAIELGREDVDEATVLFRKE